MFLPRASRNASPSAVAVIGRYIARLRKLDNLLKDGREFLCADRFTIADICITYALYLGTTLPVDGKPIADSYQPQTRSYMERMLARPSYAAAQAAQAASEKEWQAKEEAAKAADSADGTAKL